MPSAPPIAVSRSLLFLLLPVTETVTRTGLMATAAAAVRRAMPARGAIRRARGLAVALVGPCLSAAAMYWFLYLMDLVDKWTVKKYQTDVNQRQKEP